MPLWKEGPGSRTTTWAPDSVCKQKRKGDILTASLGSKLRAPPLSNKGKAAGQSCRFSPSPILFSAAVSADKEPPYNPLQNSASG